jgi:hypothetical protein
MNRQSIVKGFFGISVLLGLVLLSSAAAFRLTALPDLAKILPQEGTEGFFLIRKPDTFPWVSGRGWAQVNGTALTFLEVNSSQDAENYLLSLRAEGEELTEQEATRSLWSTVTCYPSSPNPCFTWMGDLLILSEDESLLVTLQKVAAGEQASVKDSPNYQNVRSRLASWNGGFAYFDLQKLLPYYTEDFSIFKPLLALYPAFGTSLKPQGDSWSAESFLAVDKTLIDNSAYWHPTEKYTATLLPWTSDTLAVEWGGRELGEQVQQMQTLLQKRTPEGAGLFAEKLQTQLQNLFGSETTFTELLPLLDGEQYFAFTPGSDFLFLTQFDSDAEVTQALALKDLFATHYLFAKTFQTESGETQAKLTSLTESTGQNENYQYYTFSVEDEEVATVIITEKLAIVAQKQETAFATLDRVLGKTAPRPVDSLDSILSGSNELFTVHCLLLPDGSILKTLLGDFATITTARKLFDDGIFARSLVDLSATTHASAP